MVFQANPPLSVQHQYSNKMNDLLLAKTAFILRKTHNGKMGEMNQFLVGVIDVSTASSFRLVTFLLHPEGAYLKHRALRTMVIITIRPSLSFIFLTLM